jgi:hypothetical protein
MVALPRPSQVGELAIAAAARLGGEVTPAQMKAVQGVRVDKLAVNLKAVLQRFTAGDEEGFKVRQAGARDSLLGLRTSPCVGRPTIFRGGV